MIDDRGSRAILLVIVVITAWATATFLYFVAAGCSCDEPRLRNAYAILIASAIVACVAAAIPKFAGWLFGLAFLLVAVAVAVFVLRYDRIDSDGDTSQAIPAQIVALRERV